MNRYLLIRRNDEGFVLIISMIMLLILTLLGIWGVTTSTFELQIAGNQQRYTKNLNIAEGGANQEATRVGFVARSVYEIKDPSATYVKLTTGNGANFNNPDTWNTDYLFGNTLRYGYFVTYLYPDAPPPGNDAGLFSGYKFQIDGSSRTAANKAEEVVELAGVKVGPAASI